MYGELEPIPQGEPIPLLKMRLRIGRHKSCDIVLNFANISSHHALMEIDEGYWFVTDLRSRNGIKIADKRIAPGNRKRLDPGVLIALAKHEFRIRYDPSSLGAHGEPPADESARRR